MSISAGVEIVGGAKADAALRNIQRAIAPNPKAAKIFVFAAQIVGTEARNRAPVQAKVTRGFGGFTATNFQGRLRSAIVARSLPIRPDRQIGALVKVNYSRKTDAPTAPYAHLVEFGTKPHIIKAKNGKYLVFNGTFRRQVQHPGAKAQPFFKPAVRAKTSEARQYILENVARLIEQEATSS